MTKKIFTGFSNFKLKQLKETLSETEIIVLEAYGKGFFKNVDKTEIFGKCRELAEKKGGTGKTYYNRFKDMEKYGSFKLFFPERFKVKYEPFATRLTESNIEKLKQLRKESGETTQTIINDLIEKA